MNDISLESLKPDIGNPLISIIIPSCNRQEYLVQILYAIIKNTKDAQIVVSDNSDNPINANDIENLKSSRDLIYAHQSEKISVVENFEKALNLSTGEYVIFIGDDDCIGPNIEEIALWAKNKRIEAVISYQSRFIANYFWPGVKSRFFGDKYSEKMFVNKFTGHARPVEAKKEILKAIKYPGTGLFGMARAYHGIVSRSLINRVKEKHGSLFGGVSPDIYSAVLLSHEVSNAYVLDYPFVLPGASPVSTAGTGAASKDTDLLSNRDHILRFGSQLSWDDRVPRFYSPITVWAYSTLMALKKLNDSTLKFNFLGLYIKCLINYWPLRNYIRISFDELNEKNSIKIDLFLIFQSTYFELSARLKRIWFKFVVKPRVFNNVKNIGDAYKILNAEYKIMKLN